MKSTLTRLGTILTISLVLVPPLLAQIEVEKQASPFTIEKELPRRPVISQGRTGTCWCFATTSFLETEVERITGNQVDLSEIHTVRFAYLEKARKYLEKNGKNTFDEGGLSHDLRYLGLKYGFVPLEAYPGHSAEEKGHNHAELAAVLKEMMKVYAKEGSRVSKHWQSAVIGVLDAYLGKPPELIEVNGNLMTPVAYTRDVLKIKLEDYVELMSYTYAPMNSKAELTVPDNWLHDSDYQNVSLEAFMDSLNRALSKGYSVAVDIDVSEPGFNIGKGTAELPANLEVPGAVTQEVREKMFETKQTTDDHLMHIVGISKNADGKRYYLTKDSNGPHGPYKGLMHISEAYLRGKALGLMMHKDALVTQ